MAKETILVVEDEPLVGEEIREDLERLGYSVPAVIASGDTVMESVARYKPDLILMDIRIEGSMDGIEAAYTTKAEFDIPVIYLTAYSDPETVTRAAATKPAAYLLKPFDEREVAANVALARAGACARKAGREELLNNAPLVDALEAPALLVDGEGAVAHANYRAARLFGVHDTSYLIGRNLTELALGTSMPPAPGRVRVDIGAETGAEAEASVEPLRLPDGRTIGFLVLIDVIGRAERRLLEDSVASINSVIVSRFPTPNAAGAGYKITGFLAPSAAGCGDLYDAFPVEDGKSILLVSIDIMGHGALSAMYAFALDSGIREAVLSGRTPLDLSVLARILNERTSLGFMGPSFASAALVLLERATGRYHAVSAGHPALLHVHADGTHQSVKPAGVALGAFSDVNFEEAEGTLAAGDRLILSADGLAEALGGDMSSGTALLTSLAVASQKRDAQDFVDEIRNRCLGDSQAQSMDDLGILVLERL